MIKSFFVALMCLSATVGFADTCPEAPADVAIIHYDKLTDGPTEGTAKDLFLTVVTGTPRETPCLQLTNMTKVPRKVTVRVLGLTGSEYDLYVDTNLDGTRKPSSVKAVFGEPPPIPNYRDFLVGSLTKAQLEEGVAIGLPGSVRTEAERLYLERIREASHSVAAKYSRSMRSEDSACVSIMRGMVSWVEDADNDDLDHRAVRVVVVPKGATVDCPTGSFLIPSAPDPSGYDPTLWDSFQAARANLAKLITTPSVLSDAIGALTPVDVEIVADKGALTPGEHTVTIALQNRSDREITGKVRLVAPLGSTVKPASSETSMLGYAKSEVSFVVTVPVAIKSAPKLTALATLRVKGAEFKVSKSTNLEGAK